MGAATIKYVAEYHASGKIRKIGDIVLSTCLFNLIFLPPLVLGHVFADEILAVFKIAPQDLADARLILDGVLLNFAASQVSGVFRNTLIGLQRMHVSNLCDIAYLVAYAASTVIVLGAGAGLTTVIVVLFYLRCGMGAVQVFCLLRELPHLRRHPGRVDTALLREFFRYGLKLQVNSLAGFLNFQLDKLLIGHFLRMEFVAFYEMGSKLAMAVRYVPSMMLAPLIPAAAELSVRSHSGSAGGTPPSRHEVSGSGLGPADGVFGRDGSGGHADVAGETEHPAGRSWRCRYFRSAISSTSSPARRTPSAVGSGS